MEYISVEQPSQLHLWAVKRMLGAEAGGALVFIELDSVGEWVGLLHRQCICQICPKNLKARGGPDSL
jgi:hypothetical protein